MYSLNILLNVLNLLLNVPNLSKIFFIKVHFITKKNTQGGGKNYWGED